MTSCDGTATSKKWCCGSTTDCCNTEFFVTLDAEFKATGPPIQSSVSSYLSTTTTSLTSSPTANPSTTSSLPSAPQSTANNAPVSEIPRSNSELSTGAKVGIAIGVIIGALLFFGLGFFVAKYPQWRNRGEKNDPQLPTYAEHKGPPVEMEVHPQEMYGSYIATELETESYTSKVSLR